MSAKRRILKWGLIGLLLLLFVLWFGFTTFLFNPLEDDYEYDISSLIPRTVDFYAAKADLEGDINADLTLRVGDAFLESERGRTLARLPQYQKVVDSLTLDEIREEVRASLAALPIAVNPLELFGGRDLALAGYFQGEGRPQLDWAVYGRVNWLGKLAVSLLAYPSLIDLEAQGLAVQEVEDAAEGRIGYQLTGGELVRPLVVQRVRDVVVFGTDVAMLREIPTLLRTRGEDSFGLSAKYEDRINVADRTGEELELFVDCNGLFQWKGWSGRWPNKSSDEFLPAFFGSFFQAGALNEAIGRASFGRVISLDVHASLSSELIEEGAQKNLYRRRGFDRETVLGEVAALIPEDVGVFFYGVGDVDDLLHAAQRAAEDALVSNLEDLVRSVWSYPDSEPLIKDLDAIFADRFAFCMRNNDYETLPDDPPNDGETVPAWALVLWLENPEKLREYRTTIHSRQADFGIQGREPGSQGVFEHTLRPSGKLVYEYWSPLVSGTGHLATVTDSLRQGEVFIIGNNHRLLGQMLTTYFDGSANGAPRLSELATFRTQVAAALPAANLLLWFNPKAMGTTWRGMAERWARHKVAIDWTVERPRIEKKVVKEKMQGAIWGQLTPEQEAELEILAKPELDAYEAEVRGQYGARFEAELRDQIAAVETIDALLVEVAFDKSSIDLAARLRFPLE